MRHSVRQIYSSGCKLVWDHLEDSRRGSSHIHYSDSHQKYFYSSTMFTYNICTLRLQQINTILRYFMKVSTNLREKFCKTFRKFKMKLWKRKKFGNDSGKIWRNFEESVAKITRKINSNRNFWKNLKQFQKQVKYE